MQEAQADPVLSCLLHSTGVSTPAAANVSQAFCGASCDSSCACPSTAPTCVAGVCTLLKVGWQCFQRACL